MSRLLKLVAASRFLKLAASSRVLKLAVALSAGAAVAYLLKKRGQGAAEAVKHQATVAVQKGKASVRSEATPPSDAALADKVKSKIFRPEDAPKGQVNVDVANGIVTLRGELDDQAKAEALEEAAAKVTGVRQVKNLIHQPGEAAPTLEPVAGSGG